MKPTLTVLLLLSGMLLAAQAPQWIDQQWRNLHRPHAEYLVAIVSGVNRTNESSHELLNRFEEQARANLIQQIQVEVQTTTETYIYSHNDQIAETFQLHSVSLARANIAGLQTDRYYDHRRQEGFAIAWVHKFELIRYYRNAVSNLVAEIESRFKKGKNYQERGSNQQALKTFYETMPLFNQLEEARFILMALGRSPEVDAQAEKARQYSLQVSRAIDELQQSTRSNLDELAWFMAYGLFLQLGGQNENFYLTPFTYATTGLESDFSARYGEAMQRALIRAGQYQVTELGEQALTEQLLIVGGTFWREGDQLKAHASVRQNGRAIAAAQAGMPLNWLEGNGIQWEPAAIERVNKLKNIKISSALTEINARAEMQVVTPLEASLVSHTTGQTLSDIPVQFVLAHNRQVLCVSMTNASGIARCYPDAFRASPPVQHVLAGIDMASYTGLDPASAFYTRLVQNHQPNPARITVHVEPLRILVNSLEKDHYNGDMAVRLIEPALKAALARAGYSFSNSAQSAELMISVDAKARHGSAVHGIYFAYVDASVSITDLGSGRELYKSGFNSVKGAGADFRRAVVNAYEETAAEISQAVFEWIY